MRDITILLNSIGLILIIVSLIYIKNISSKEEYVYKQIITLYDDIKYYYDAIENITTNFNDLVDNSLVKVEKIQSEHLRNNSLETMEYDKDIIHTKKIKPQELITKNSNTPIHEEIIELRKNGLSSKEIAKKLNKGVREIEIILKMIEKNV